MQRKYLVIYHANCTDGFTAAWVFHHYSQKFPEAHDQYDFHAANYGSEPPDGLSSYHTVYLVDFSYSREVVAGMLEETQVVLIDHHVTAIQELRDLPGLRTYTDIERSGARLAWDFLFHKEPAPRLIDYVQDRDLWKWKLPNSKEVSSFISSVTRTFEDWSTLLIGSEDVTKLTRYMTSGQAILRVQDRLAAEMARGAVFTDFAGHADIPVANVPGAFASDVGHILSEKAPFAVTYHFAHGKMLVSLRSRETGVDVSAIAKYFGGGGHEHAAGFTVDHVDAASFFKSASWGNLA